MIFANWEFGWEAVIGIASLFATVLTSVVVTYVTLDRRLTKTTTRLGGLADRVGGMNGKASITRLETKLDSIQAELTEAREDVKSLFEANNGQAQRLSVVETRLDGT